MKKILWFCLSLGVSGLLFLLTVAACFVFSKTSGKPSDNSSSKSFEANGFVMNVSVIFTDEATDRLFAAVLTLDGFDKTAESLQIDCEKPLKNGKSLRQIYKTEGLYPFADSVKQAFCKNSVGFIKFNSKSFEIITDRFKNIVYNDENNGKMLLPGVEAAQKLNSETFAEYCEVLCFGVLSSDMYNEYLILTEICETDLPYPFIYDVVRGNIS